MRIGLIDVDSHNFPNIALMKLSSWHKAKGDDIEWAIPMMQRYDRIYASKVFTFTNDFNRLAFDTGELITGGTGYDITSRLPDDVDRYNGLDYSLYGCKFSVQFYSRGCIRHCPFCLVHDKEGGIHPVDPMEWNGKAEWIEVLDNNFFANPEWRFAVDDLMRQKLPVKLHGVDVRIMDEEQAYWLNKMRLKGNVHIAWDLPNIDLTEKLESVIKYIKPYKITCYVLVGFNSTVDQDLFRLRTLKRLRILPFVQPYRDYDNKREPSQYEKDIARWANRAWLFQSMDFADYKPRKGFKCSEYFR